MKISLLLAATAALTLTACDNGPSAVAKKQAAGTQMAENQGPSASSSDASYDDNGAPQVDHRKDPVKLMDGKPMWAASRKSSAQESAQRAFARNGDDFGADNLEDFVGKAHAFVEHPPKGTLTLVRNNGDKLFYDPKGNVFAVASKAGAPRTMFKPRDGMEYWDQQKTREAKRQTARRNRGSDDA